MNIEELREFCLTLPGVTEDIKWGDNLVFSVGGKMFCLADLKPPLRVSLKVPKEVFPGITDGTSILQAPYFARMHWVLIADESILSPEEWEAYLQRSYELVRQNLPKKIRALL